MRDLIESAAAQFLLLSGLTGPAASFAQKYALRSGRLGKRPAHELARSYQVLNYHRIDHDDDPFLLGPVTPSQFEAQVRFLKRHFKVFPLRELLDRAADGTLPAGAVSLTFDDGYRDNYRVAFPILRKYGLPATLFLATTCAEDRQPLWYDKVFFAFKKTKEARADLADFGYRAVELATVEARRAAMFALADRFRAVPDAERLEGLAELFRRLKVSDFSEMESLLIGWDEVRELDRGGFAVEAHTVTHPILSRLPADRLDAELSGSKRLLESRLQREVTLFAYPNGKPEDFGEAVKDAVRRNGFRCAFTTVPGVNGPGSDAYALKRATPWHYGRARFALDEIKIQLTA